MMDALFFSMDGSSYDGFGTIILNGEEVPIIIEGFPYAVSIRRSDESSEGHISGIPKYRNESKFVVKIDYSTHPDYPDGEKIVFTKVE